MRPVAQGRPDTQVIPDGWAAAHGTAVVGTMTATVSLRKPGGTSQWSEEDQATITVPHTPYETGVPARIQAVVSGSTAADVVGETIHVRGYLIGLPASVTVPDADDLVTVTACDDASLIGRELAITDVLRGSLLFERDMFATLND